MKLRIVSDLHCEFHKDGGYGLLEEITGGSSFDVLVIAGDMVTANILDNLKELLSYVGKKSPQVVFVPGNHEYYGGEFSSVKDKLAALRRYFSGEKLLRTGRPKTNVHILDDLLDFVPIAPSNYLAFLGSTLWFRDDGQCEKYSYRLNDYGLIKGFRENVYTANQEAIDLIMEYGGGDDSIIVTHHTPSFQSIHKDYRGSELNRFFACDMDEVIKDSQPKLWIHGHTHSSFDYQLYDTRIICNPFGYAGYDENKAFNPHLTVEV